MRVIRSVEVRLQRSLRMCKVMVPPGNQIAAAKGSVVLERCVIGLCQQWSGKSLAISAAIRIALDRERIVGRHIAVDAETSASRIPSVVRCISFLVCRRVPLEVLGIGAVISLLAYLAAESKIDFGRAPPMKDKD